MCCHRRYIPKLLPIQGRRIYLCAERDEWPAAWACSCTLVHQGRQGRSKEYAMKTTIQSAIKLSASSVWQRKEALLLATSRPLKMRMHSDLTFETESIEEKTSEQSSFGSVLLVVPPRHKDMISCGLQAGSISDLWLKGRSLAVSQSLQSLIQSL